MQTEPIYRVIHVTHDDIKNGKRSDCHECAVALSMKREAADLIKKDCLYEITASTLYVKKANETIAYFMWSELSPDADKIEREIDFFDGAQGKMLISPFTFRLDIAHFMHILKLPPPIPAA